MGKIKIGIYVFTNQIKERIITDKDKYFDGKAYYGFNYVISEIDKLKYDINFVSSLTFNSVSFVLVSITSFYDIFNIRKELFGKKIQTKFIFGGAGISNIQCLTDIAYAICLGRGETLINDIIEGKKIENVWYRNSELKIKIGQPKKLITINSYSEKSVGCNDKCKFCQYGWKYKQEKLIDGFNSGYNNREDTIKNIDFSLCNRATAPRLNSAIDGFTEQTRKLIGKKISNKDITDKLSEIYIQKQPYFALKLYAIVGFPWEKKIELSEFINSVKLADKKSDKKLNIFLVSTHFVPMPFTPFESFPVNLHDFREEVKKMNYKYSGESINVFYPYSQIPGFISAIEQCIINRINSNELPIFDRVILNHKYIELSSAMKLKVIDKYFPGIYSEFNNVCPDVERPFKYSVLKAS